VRRSRLTLLPPPRHRRGGTLGGPHRVTPPPPHNSSAATTTRRRAAGRAGHTLAEFMVATAISLIVIAGMVAAFTYHYRTSWALRETQTMFQDLRFALNTMLLDLDATGYGLAPARTNLSQWVAWAGSISTNPYVQQGANASDPDRLTVVGAGSPIAATLSQDASTNDIDPVLHVLPHEGFTFNTWDKGLIVVDRTELARVVSIAGNNLTYSTHPVTNGARLKYSHKLGAPVEVVQAITYSCETDGSGTRYLRRDAHTAGLTDQDIRIAAGIENLQITSTSNTLTVTLTGRTKTEDHRYVDPDHADGYRRRTLSTTVLLRNNQ
jgi:Tfp pilus assembly protein PilW